MRKSLYLGALPLSLAVIAGVCVAVASTGYGQVTLVNQTSQMLDLHVDDHYGCRALAGLTCSTMERAGVHVLIAKSSDGQEVSQEIDLADGGTFTYTVSEN